MFEIVYNNKSYFVKSAIKVSNKDYLIYALGDKGENMFFNTKNFSQLEEVKDILKRNNSPLEESDIHNIDKDEEVYFGQLEYKNVNFYVLPLKEQLFIYKNIIGSSKINDSLKNELIISIRKTLFQYKNKGRIDFDNNLKDLVKLSYDLDEDLKFKEIKLILEEFRIFIKIKAYENMNLYELLMEKDRLSKFIDSEADIYELGFPEESKEILKNRILPAIKVLIRLKEDIMLWGLLNFYRNPILLNPFEVLDLENLNLDSSEIYFKNASDYLIDFYNNLGISTDFKKEIESINPWQCEYLSEHIYGIAGSHIYKNFKNSKEFLESIRENIKEFSEIKFYDYFLKFIIKTINK